MKYFFSSTLFLLSLACCGQKAKYADNVLINGKLGWSDIRQSAVSKALGKPDSIVHNPAGCGTQFDVDDSLAYYGGVVFEKNKDTLDLSWVDFTAGSSDFMQFGKLKLTANTSYEEIAKFYSLAADRDTSEVEDYATGKRIRIIDIDVSPEAYEYQKWYLIFYHRKLIRLEMWIAC